MKGWEEGEGIFSEEVQRLKCICLNFDKYLSNLLNILLTIYLSQFWHVKIWKVIERGGFSGERCWRWLILILTVVRKSQEFSSFKVLSLKCSTGAQYRRLWTGVLDHYMWGEGGGTGELYLFAWVSYFCPDTPMHPLFAILMFLHCCLVCFSYHQNIFVSVNITNSEKMWQNFVSLQLFTGSLFNSDGREKYELGQDLVWLKWREGEGYATLKEDTKYARIYCNFTVTVTTESIFLKEHDELCKDLNQRTTLYTLLWNTKMDKSVVAYTE